MNTNTQNIASNYAAAIKLADGREWNVMVKGTFASVFMGPRLMTGVFDLEADTLHAGRQCMGLDVAEAEAMLRRARKTGDAHTEACRAMSSALCSCTGHSLRK